MNKIVILILALVVCVSSAFVAGCTQKADDSQAAIAQSQKFKTVEEQADYLVSQANMFLNSKEFDEAIQTARYVLSNLDQESDKAKAVIEKAKTEMQKVAEGAVSDIKKSLGSIGQ